MESTDNEDSRSLKAQLSDILNDVSSIVQQLAVSVTVPKQKRTVKNASGKSELLDLTTLLMEKRTQLETTLEKAHEYAHRRQLIDRLQMEVAKRDEVIDKVHDTLKDAEHTLITSIFQANQKLKSIRQAESRRTNSSELMQLAHRISRTNAVAAPLNWKLGDTERPYPTDVEMRQGWLSEAQKAQHHPPHMMPPIRAAATTTLLEGTSTVPHRPVMPPGLAVSGATPSPVFGGPRPGVPRAPYGPPGGPIQSPTRAPPPHMAPPMFQNFSPTTGSPSGAPAPGAPPPPGYPPSSPAMTGFMQSGGRMSAPFPAAAQSGQPTPATTVPPPPPYAQVPPGVRGVTAPPWHQARSPFPAAAQMRGAPVRTMSPFGQSAPAAGPRPGVSPQIRPGFAAGQAQVASPHRQKRSAGTSNTPPMRLDSMGRPTTSGAPDVEVMSSDSSSSSSSDSDGGVK